MTIKSKYRVKVTINNYGVHPETRYVIQKKTMLGWVDKSDATRNKNWAYDTCEEMNMDYEDIRAKNKLNQK